MLLAAATTSAGDWTYARAGTVEVLAETGDADARRVAAEVVAFQPLAAATLDALGLPLPPGDPGPALRVLVVRPATFEDLVPRERRGLLGGFARSTAREAMLAVRADAPASTLRHEVAHVALNARLPAQPLWLAEGLADLLASAEATPGGLVVGAPIASHVALLRQLGAQPVAPLLAAGQESSSYAPGAAQEAFGATAWLLAHRLVVGEGGGGRVRRFVDAIAAGTARDAALQQAFGLDVQALEAQLDAWRARDDLPRWRVGDAPSAVPVPVAVEVAGPGDADLALGQLLLAVGRSGDAARYLERSVAADAVDPAAHEALAEARVRQRRLPEARRHVDIARQLDPRRSRGLVRLAEIRLQEGLVAGGDLAAAERDAVALADEALALDPRDADAVELRARVDPRPLALWIERLADVLRRDPGRAEAAVTLAGLHLRRYEMARAAEVLLQVRERTSDESLRFVSDHMMKRIAEARRGTVEARGRLVRVECPPGAPPRFRLRPEGAAEVTLSTSTTTSFPMFDEQGEAGERTFVCGPQDLPVSVRYRPLPDGGALLLSLAVEPRGLEPARR